MRKSRCWEKGLDRQVKWSHVLEVKDFGSLINGGEMILTTGVGLQVRSPYSNEIY